MTESILQFGAGRFLRGFVDRFIADRNRSDAPVGHVVVVQSTPGQRAEMINNHPQGYPVVVRGIESGEVVQRVETVDCISRALVASQQWAEVLEIGTSDSLRMVVSNATEAGYVLSQQRSPVPETLPGKLTALLHARFHADKPPLVLLPCELISRNAEKLCELVTRQAEIWDLGRSFSHYVTDHCVWANNLVDCIISNLLADDPLLAENPLTIMAEPYALLAIDQQSLKGASVSDLPLLQHPAVQLVEDLEPYYLRKVRVLNGVHTAMVAKFLGSELETVQAVLADAAGRRWTRDLLYGEILPTLLGRVSGAVQFVDDTLDRFANPFLAHRLSDISLNHQQKVPVRLVPTADDFQQLFGSPPPLLRAAIERKLEH